MDSREAGWSGGRGWAGGAAGVKGGTVCDTTPSLSTGSGTSALNQVCCTAVFRIDTRKVQCIIQVLKLEFNRNVLDDPVGTDCFELGARLPSVAEGWWKAKVCWGAGADGVLAPGKGMRAAR